MAEEFFSSEGSGKLSYSSVGNFLLRLLRPLSKVLAVNLMEGQK